MNGSWQALFDGAGSCDISVLVPAYNEAESLAALIERVLTVYDAQKLRGEILVIDDGSDDATPQVLREISDREPRLHWVRFQRNYGKSAALAVGFARAQGEIVVTMDGDLQDDPDEIPALLDKLALGFDLVSGWKKERKDPFVKTSTSRLFNFVTRLATGLKLHDFNCGLKAYRKAVVDSLHVYGEMHRYLPVLAHVLGFRVTEIPVRHHARQHGVTKFGRARFLNGMFDLMTVLFLTRQRTSPLHFFGRVGVLFGAFGAGICLYFFVIWLQGAGLHLRPLMLLGIALLLLALQFVSLGLLAEMLVASRDTTSHYRIRDER